MTQTQHKPVNGRGIALAALAIVLLVIAVYAVVRLGSRGEVLGSVTVLDVELSGSTSETATAALSDLESRLATMPAPARIEGTDVSILPENTGLDLHEEALVEAALAVGRSDNPVSDFFWWLTHLTGSTPVEPVGEIDPDALDTVLDGFDESVIGSPPFQGAIELNDGVLEAQYPRAGRRVDRAHAEDALLASFLTLDRPPVELVVRNEEPSLTSADVDAALAEAETMLSAPITLTAGNGTSLTFEMDDLRDAFVSTTHDDPARIELGFDEDAVEQRVSGVRTEFEAAPVNARFEIDGYDVVIVDGANGTLLAAEETAEALVEASRAPSRQADLPLQEGAEPEVTTADLEALDIRHLVSQFTTYHDCCAARVTNIQLMADKVDGVILQPGESFSLNEHVGARTAEDGFLPAGTIIGGEIVDTVGGGVSQFATTFYNAVFWGGYEDVEHKPHSFYFSRYPEGIEATISWPLPDLVFRNNDDSGILIRTSYTDTSITVRFYGNNDGRILSGEQSGGQLGVGVVSEGGPEAKQVRGDRSDRFNFRDPPSPLYRANPDLDVDESRVVQSPGEGWSVTVTRTITIGDETTTEEWPVRYLPQQEIIEVHPCQVPDAEQTCPTTTTTTTTTEPPPSTTTTEPPPSTTTTQPQQTTTTTTTEGGG